MTAARTPWFSAQSQPPVNGGPDAVYEWRCRQSRYSTMVKPWEAKNIIFYACPHCQWRGLTKPGSKG